MTFTEYVLQQKNKIKTKHYGEEYLVIQGEIYPLRSCEEVLNDLNGIQGLFGARERRQAQARKACAV